MRGLLISAVAAAVIAGSSIVGCSGADEHPLGGPYGGGAGGAPNPSHGNGASTGGGGDGTSTGDDAGTQIDDSGNPLPPSNDSGTNPPPPGHDSGAPPPPGQDSGGPPPPPPPPAAPTWSHIWQTYFANGTAGGCPGCHSQMSTAAKSYSWLQGKGYISGTSSAIVSTSRSDLTWFGGNMPPNGPSSLSSAANDMKAWVAAGAQNN